MTSDSSRQTSNLGSDAPLADPSKDAFGHAPFARTIANAVQTTPSPQGLVMLVDGPWGSGKSTLLNFVRHYVRETEGTGTSSTVIIDFNPWWFESRDQLARQFLQQFSAQLRKESELLRFAADKMAEYADVLGTAVEHGVSTFVSIPYLGTAVTGLLKLFKRRDLDVPKLKTEVAKAIEASKTRFVVIIDDIDRLTPDEIRDVFKAVKALADFPNVVYLMAFDKPVIESSLESALGIKDPAAYLEKIIQVPFTLPVVEHRKLEQKFLLDLSKALATLSIDALDDIYWWNLFHDGLSPLLRKPRDLIRISNALAVTLATVVGEVHLADFIGIEFVRVFAPLAYNVVRGNEDHFVGTLGEMTSNDRQQEQEFHDEWLGRLTPQLRAPIKALLRRMFPAFGALYGGKSPSNSALKAWQREARIAVPDHFTTYFRFGVDQDQLSRAELKAFIELRDNVQGINTAFSKAFGHKRPDGSKGEDLLEGVANMDALEPEFCRAGLHAAFQFGDAVLREAQEVPAGFAAVPAAMRLYWFIARLARGIPLATRAQALASAISSGSSLATAAMIVNRITRLKDPGSDDTDSPFIEFTESQVKELVDATLRSIRDMQSTSRLLGLPNLSLVLSVWERWGIAGEASSWVITAFKNDDNVLPLLRQFLSVGSRQTLGDRVAMRHVTFDANQLNGVLQPSLDVEWLAERLHKVVMLRQPLLTKQDRETIDAFEQGMTRFREGLSPNDPF